MGQVFWDPEVSGFIKAIAVRGTHKEVHRVAFQDIH